MKDAKKKRESDVDDTVVRIELTSKTGIPAMGLSGSSCAAGLTMSLPPKIKTVSVSGKSSLMSSMERVIS